MKTITTSRNKSFPITWAQVITRKNAPAQLVIELPKEQTLAHYVAHFEDSESLKLVDDTQPGAYTMYEGYDHVANMVRKDGAVRITLERSGDA
jgi:hypothetical protein